MDRAYFCAYHSLLDTMEALNDAEKGRLFVAALIYSATGEAPELRGNERFLFPQIKWQIDRDEQAYAERCTVNAENGKKGGRPKKQTVFEETERFLEKPKKPKEKKKKNTNTKINNNIPPKSPQGGVLEELSPELREAIEGFIEYRKKIKKPMTDRAVELLIGKLYKMASTDAERVEMLNQSVLNGWQGVFELKGEAKKTGTNNVFLAMMQEEGF